MRYSFSKIRKLLSVVLVLSLLIVSFAQAGVLVASADGTVPTYDSTLHDIIWSTNSGQITSASPVFYAIPSIEDTTVPVYSRITVTKSSGYTGWYSPFVMLAKTDYKTSAEDTNTYYLGMRLIAGYGWWIGLLNGQNYVLTITQGTYPDGSNTLPSPVDLVTKIVNGEVSVWIGDKNILTDYTNANFNIVDIAAGGCINGYGCYLYIVNYVDKIPEPIFSANSQVLVGSYSSGLMTNSIAEFQTMEGIADNTKPVYSRINITKSTGYTGWFSPYVMLAETDYKASVEDNNTYYLGMRLIASYGWWLGLLNGQSQALTIAEGTYSGGSNNMPSPVRITYVLNNGKISIWLDGEMILKSFSDGRYNLAKATVGSSINGYGYYLSGGSWVNKDNYLTDLPVFNSQTDALMIDKAEIINGGNLEKYDAYYVEDYLAPIYTEYIVKKENYVTGWFSPCVAFAETDYISGDNEYYLGMRMTDYGYSICLMDSNMNQAQLIVDGQVYPDTETTTMSNDYYTITVKTDNGTVSVWFNGTKILDEYSNDEVYTIMGPAAYGYINGYSYGIRVRTWTEIENYNRLGDLNGDAFINVLDLVYMKKIIANVEGVAPINEYVIAFNEEGTIGADELILMVQYLIGTIDSFDDPEYGYDAVNASALL